MQDQVRLQVSGKLENLPFVIEFIIHSMQKFGMSDHDLFQTQIAVDEAVTNIIEHGGLGENDKITLKCEKKEDRVQIIIEDKGKPFDPTTIEEPNVHAPLGERKTGGLGVYFIKKYMDQVKYDYIGGKNIFTLIKYL